MIVLMVGLWAVGLGVSDAWAQGPQIVAPGVEIHQIESRFVDQTFEIYVQVPVHRADDSERFGVLYLTDSYEGLAFSGTSSIMQLGGDIPRLITVGIGYPLQNRLEALDIRTRDLTQVESDTPPMLSSFVKDARELELAKRSGGAADFLRFIRDELQPFIDENYPTNPEDRGYWGDSLGGLFGLYVLFNEPDTFNRYIIGSPSIWWADRAIMNDAAAFVDSRRALHTRVFLGVGALEERGPGDAAAAMVTNMFQLETMLREAKIDGLELTSIIHPNQTHTSAVALNYIHGVQAVYTRPTTSWLVELLAPPDAGN